MKPVPAFVVTWALTGLGAVIGSILGNAVGKPGLFTGAIVGGILGVGVAVLALVKLGWLPNEDRACGFVGGVAGFAVAAPLAAMNLHTPVIPVLVSALSSLGLLLSVRVQHRRRRP